MTPANRPAEGAPEPLKLTYTTYESLAEAQRLEGDVFNWVTLGWDADRGRPSIVWRLINHDGVEAQTGIPGSLETSEPAAQAIVTAVNERPALQARLAAADRLARAAADLLWAYDNDMLAASPWAVLRAEAAAYQAAGAPADTCPHKNRYTAVDQFNAGLRNAAVMCSDCGANLTYGAAGAGEGGGK